MQTFMVPSGEFDSPYKVRARSFYFRTDESSRPAYVNQKMKPFRPKAGVALRAYHEVPADVLEDADQLVEWARVAIACVPPARRGSRRSRE